LPNKHEGLCFVNINLPNFGKGWQAGGDVHLHFNRIGIDAQDGTAENFGQQGPLLVLGWPGQAQYLPQTAETYSKNRGRRQSFCAAESLACKTPCRRSPSQVRATVADPGQNDLPIRGISAI